MGRANGPLLATKRTTHRPSPRNSTDQLAFNSNIGLMMVLHSCTTGSFFMSNSPIAGTILHVPDGVGLLAT